MSIVQVALPIPMRQHFDYQYQGELPLPGCRVRVPFGSRSLIGVVIGHKDTPDCDISQLKMVQEIMDKTPIVNTAIFELCRWCANYYHYPLGMVLYAAIPAQLRKGLSAEPKPELRWQLTQQGQQALPTLTRAAKQQALLKDLLDHTQSDAALKSRYSNTVLNAVKSKGFILPVQQTKMPEKWHYHDCAEARLTASVDQALAVTRICESLDSFGVTLLEGVTGSGKTEVYLQAIEPVLRQGKQVLILVPEIGLTPQMIARFERRFALPMGILHSNLNDQQRLRVWQQANADELAIIIGTRSAIFTPMPNLGLIVVDEEHDGSFKQQDGLRYHARDLAIVRARQTEVPVVLGSATPSLESLHNARQGKYQHCVLPQRAAGASTPKLNLLDLKDQPLQAGLAKGVLQRMQWHLQQGNQVLVFLNRRGYAPALICHQCGHIEQCQSCERPFTLHRNLHKLHCHHCGAVKAIPRHCQYCHSQQLNAEGVGTEQIEQALAEQFIQYPPVRIDSDTIRGKDKLEQLLGDVQSLKHRLLVGTQILSKGHHFPHVTMVVIMGVDAGLHSADYRSQEKLAQLIVQLSGRAGRAEKPGEIWLQTHDPGHPMLQELVNNGYQHFAASLLQERQYGQLPPCTFQALFRAEANHIHLAQQFLTAVIEQLQPFNGVQLFGPKPALLEKRQGRYRMQLVVQGQSRALLQQVLKTNIGEIEALPLAKKVRWSVDVDPQDFS